MCSFYLAPCSHGAPAIAMFSDILLARFIDKEEICHDETVQKWACRGRFIRVLDAHCG
jgi:hypothetical protein